LTRIVGKSGVFAVSGQQIYTMFLCFGRTDKSSQNFILESPPPGNILLCNVGHRCKWVVAYDSLDLYAEFLLVCHE
jgi:hypothetical protein